MTKQTYTVRCSETVFYSLEVKANSADEAEKLLENGDIVPTEKDITGYDDFVAMSECEPDCKDCK